MGSCPVARSAVSMTARRSERGPAERSKAISMFGTIENQDIIKAFTCRSARFWLLKVGLGEEVSWSPSGQSWQTWPSGIQESIGSREFVLLMSSSESIKVHHQTLGKNKSKQNWILVYQYYKYAQYAKYAIYVRFAYLYKCINMQNIQNMQNMSMVQTNTPNSLKCIFEFFLDYLHFEQIWGVKTYIKTVNRRSQTKTIRESSKFSDVNSILLFSI